MRRTVGSARILRFGCTVTIYPSPMTGILAPELRVKLLLPSTVVMAAAGAAAAVVVVAADAMMRVVLGVSLWLLSVVHVRVVEQSGIIEPKEVRGKREIKSVIFWWARSLIHLLAYQHHSAVHHQQ